jgi:hypothetical protein
MNEVGLFAVVVPGGGHGGILTSDVLERGSSFARRSTHAMKLHEWGTRFIGEFSRMGHPPLNCRQVCGQGLTGWRRTTDIISPMDRYALPCIGISVIVALCGCIAARNVRKQEQKHLDWLANLVNIDANDTNVEPITEMQAKNLALIYSENAHVAATFWEWRHKLMERFFLVIGAIIGAEGWIYHEGSLRKWLFGPLLLASVFSLISFLMDRVNYKILRGCYEVGRNVEARLSGTRGVYTGLDRRFTYLNYSYLLRILYVASACAFLVAAGVAFFKFMLFEK